jgi:DNA-binding transcriptional LysR family regulator
MDIDRVGYFCVFADTGSLVKASEVLRISQPALSKALRLLESETGLSLLEANGRGLRLTQDGEAFKEAVTPLLSQWKAIPEVLKSKVSTQSEARIGSFEVFTTYFLGHFLQNHPLRNVEIHEVLPGRIEDALLEKKIDLGITYGPVPRAGVKFTEAARVKMGVFGLRKFRSEKAQNLPFVIPIQPLQGVPSKAVGLDGWPDHRHIRRIEFRVALMESALELCRRGLAVAYLPDFIARLHNISVKPEFRLLELDCPLTQAERMQSVFLVQRANGDEGDPVFKAVAKALRSAK